jgi:hypothetical protein
MTDDGYLLGGLLWAWMGMTRGFGGLGLHVGHEVELGSHLVSHLCFTCLSSNVSPMSVHFLRARLGGHGGPALGANSAPLRPWKAGAFIVS